MGTKLNDSYVSGFVSEAEISSMQSAVDAAHDTLTNGTGAGNDFLGWLRLPENYDKEEFARIKAAAAKIQKNSQALVVIGIGGSYLGARAAIEFVKSSNYNLMKKDTPDIYFSGNSISSTALCELMSILDGKDFAINVISKSGTTTEPSIAFRALSDMLLSKYGTDGAKDRIFCTTDRSRGALKKLADEEGYETFVVPDDIGGRYSVLTAVGLLPIAVAGIDIDRLMLGARDAMNGLNEKDITKNDCYRYAAYRNLLLKKGKNVEMMVSYEPSYAMMNEWFKQLFGESEGKDNKGIFPASAVFSTDLHSLGQYIQQGRRMLFETAVVFDSPREEYIIKHSEDNVDGLNFLEGKKMSYVNRRAFEATTLSHTDGGVPVLVLQCEKMDEYELGYLFYFLEKACAISGYILGVNPFNQPGVESYKRNMFALLSKPGYESERDALELRLRSNK